MWRGGGSGHRLIREYSNSIDERLEIHTRSWQRKQKEKATYQGLCTKLKWNMGEMLRTAPGVLQHRRLRGCNGINGEREL